MDKKQFPDKANLYRLPWSTTDNPIGWVEITDICNIHCEGCYRMILGDGHKPLEKIKEEILLLKKWRNCDGISLAGGEPILHPQILDIIQFISDNDMKSLILTNGYALTEELVRNLKKAGLTGLSFHIDSTQRRPEFHKEKVARESDMNELRLKFAALVKRVGGLYAHFGITVTRKNLAEVPAFIQWGIDNFSVVSGISLITYRGLAGIEGVEYHDSSGKKIDVNNSTLGYVIPTSEMANASVSSKEVYAVIKEHFPEYEATAYLGGTIDHTSFKWLIGNIIVGKNGKLFGAYGKKTIEWAQAFYHMRYGKYLVYPRVKMGKKLFALVFVDKKIRKAFARFMGYVLRNPLRLFSPVKAIGIGVIQAPDLMPDGRIDMCDDCPDMCVFNGKLVNSCRLDECRKFGCLLHVHVSGEKTKQMLEEYHQEN